MNEVGRKYKVVVQPGWGHTDWGLVTGEKQQAYLCHVFYPLQQNSWKSVKVQSDSYNNWLKEYLKIHGFKGIAQFLVTMAIKGKNQTIHWFIHILWNIYKKNAFLWKQPAWLWGNEIEVFSKGFLLNSHEKAVHFMQFPKIRFIFCFIWFHLLQLWESKPALKILHVGCSWTNLKSIVIRPTFWSSDRAICLLLSFLVLKHLMDLLYSLHTLPGR